MLIFVAVPSIFVSGVVVQLLSLPIGRFFEWALPTTRFNTFGYVWTLNPGPFNAKEHTVITVMAKVVELGAYATDLLLSQELFYGKNFGFGYELMICLSSQLMGYSFAGLFRRFLVWPSSMIWPGALVNAALFNTLHQSYSKRDKKHMSRQRFFVIAAAASFVWYWFPGYIFTALSWFTWVCWIAPNNAVVNSLFGYASGLGMGFLTFDWAMISYFGSPLVIPVSFILSGCGRKLLTASLVVGPSEHHDFVHVLVLAHRSNHLLHQHMEHRLLPSQFP